MPQEQAIISTLDLELPFFKDITDARFRAFRKMLSEHDRETILWLTKPSQILCNDPVSAQTIGFARTIRSELANPFIPLEIDPTEGAFGTMVLRVFKKVTSRNDSGTLAPDMEYAVVGGVINVGGHHPFSLKEELNQKSIIPSADYSQTLDIMKPGLIQTFQWSEKVVGKMR